jgi:hypothetical protein
VVPSDAEGMMGEPKLRPSTAAGEWRCARCRRFLARIERDTFTRPNGDSGRLPAVIRCKCGERNVGLEDNDIWEVAHDH